MNSLIVYGACALILLIAALRGRRIGFLRSAFSVLTIVISILLVNTFSPVVGSAIRSTPIPNMIYRTVYRNLEREIRGIVDEKLPGNESADLDSRKLSGEQQQQWMQSAGIPRWVRDTVYEGSEQAASAIAEKASRLFADFVVDVMGFVLSLVLMWISLQVISMFLGIVDHIPVLHGVNHSLGTVLGLAEGLLLIWFLSLLVTAFAPSHLGSSILGAIEESPVLSAVYSFLVNLGR